MQSSTRPASGYACYRSRDRPPMASGITKTPVRTARNWLADDPGFAELARRVDDLVAIQATLARACPGLPVTVASLSAGTLNLTVPGAAWASRLRQSEPSIIATLAAQGLRVERLKIRPARQFAAPGARAQPRSPIPPATLSRMAEIESTMEPGALRQALSRLLQARGKRG
jgi:hypothetical protein